MREIKLKIFSTFFFGTIVVFIAVVAGYFVFFDTQNAPMSFPEQETSSALQTIEKQQEPHLGGDVVISQNSFDASSQATTNLQSWMIIAISVMAIVTLIAIGISFYLYRWRKILLNNQHLVVPEQFGGWINGLANNLAAYIQEVSTSIERTDIQGQETHQNLEDLSETFMTMQRALDEREVEIRRFKNGYDAHIFRKFVSRFIRVDQAVEDIQREGENNPESLEQIRYLLADAFAECGVECFDPQIGEDYRKADGVAERPKTVATQNAQDAFKIMEIIESGYLIRSAENTEVVIPAKVRIFTYQEGEAK